MTKAEILKALEPFADDAPIYCQHPEGGSHFRIETVELWTHNFWSKIEDAEVPVVLLGPDPESM